MFLGPHKMIMSHYFMSLWYPLELGTFLIFWRKASLTHMVKSVYGRKSNSLNFLPVNLSIFPYSKKIKGTICHGLGWREVCSCTARGLGSLFSQSGLPSECVLVISILFAVLTSGEKVLHLLSSELGSIVRCYIFSNPKSFEHVPDNGDQLLGSGLLGEVEHWYPVCEPVVKTSQVLPLIVQ